MTGSGDPCAILDVPQGLDSRTLTRVTKRSDACNTFETVVGELDGLLDGRVAGQPFQVNGLW
ncbi:MAG: hypothetical protein KFB96_20510 [Thiocapsa sp.]|uniref:hypothetical protein n=1 Tax=Thiocapsa sp. TaxID=2024551 RepID=UPI001BCFB968|nr:hypothetical protein [Thiocapsa sp.]QVL48008.1 MAG: hypothetical protein KFB96_20510 [Thiocapsa sp.]